MPARVFAQNSGYKAASTSISHNRKLSDTAGGSYRLILKKRFRRYIEPWSIENAAFPII